MHVVSSVESKKEKGVINLHWQKETLFIMMKKNVLNQSMFDGV